MMESMNEIITIAKRDNNNKRSFLLVNPSQGKHIPVSPGKTIRLIKQLSELLAPDLKNENCLVIGFAETATAIGAILAAALPFAVRYIHTTRETIAQHEYLFFSEEHSHATEQKLIKTTMDQYMSDQLHIIFAEDEVTTGKTIENIIAILKNTYPQFQLHFSIVSILNGMPDEKKYELKARGIGCYYLSTVPRFDYDQILSQYQFPEQCQFNCQDGPEGSWQTLSAGDFSNARTGVWSNQYQDSCTRLAKQICAQIDLNALKGQTILILGTEECMYPGLFFGHYLEQLTGNHEIYFHATTRSPILPSDEADYPIKKRYQLTSFYDNDRTTFIYNLRRYDKVFIVTDSDADTDGMKSLCHALSSCQNDDITKIIWRT